MEVISDTQIQALISERKILSKNFQPNLKEKNGQNQFEKEVTGINGNTFKIIVRQSIQNPLDFSVIFGVVLNGRVFRLKRYNGDSHNHTNKLETIEIQGFHIHTATQRYQEQGFREENFAEKTSKYFDWKSALKFMLKENNFEPEIDKEQKRLM